MFYVEWFFGIVFGLWFVFGGLLEMFVTGAFFGLTQLPPMGWVIVGFVVAAVLIRFFIGQ